MADRAYARGGVRTEGGGCRPADAVRGSGSDAGGLRIERPGDEHLPGVGSHRARAVLSVCGRDFAASILFKRRDGNRRRQLEILGVELEYGAANCGGGSGLRFCSWTAQVAEETLAFVRRMECLVPGKEWGSGEWKSAGGAAPAGGSVQPGGRAAGWRVHQHAAALGGSCAHRLPGAVGKRDCAADDECEWTGATDDFVSL